MSIVQSVKSFYGNSWITTIGGAVCTAAATELALRAVYQYATLSKLSNQDKAKQTYAISGNLGGAITLALCATNYIPGFTRAAAACFWVYSWAHIGNRDQYGTSQLINGKALLDWVIEPLCNHVLEPLGKRIWAAFTGFLALIHIQEHPIWYAVAGISLIFVGAKGVKDDWFGVATKGQSLWRMLSN